MFIQTMKKGKVIQFFNEQKFPRWYFGNRLAKIKSLLN
jgi:hypothetical protein